MAELSKAIARLMEEQRRDHSQAPADPPPVREAVDSSRAQVAPGERALAEHFVRLFATTPGAAALDERELSALAMVAFRYLVERTAEEPRVRAFSPDMAHEGWEASGTVLQVLMRDRPYIVDTIRESLREAECRIETLLAPTFHVERDPRRAVLAIDPPGPIGPHETFVHVQLERHPEPQVIAHLVADRLRDLILATEDESAMRLRLEETAAELRERTLPRPWSAEAGAAAEFLEWLAAGHFVMLGYREYELSGQGLERYARLRPGSGLGILQSEDLSRYAQAAVLSDALRRRLHEPPLVMLSKTNARSTVARRDYMDYVGVKVIDSAGVVVGERRFLGLYDESARAAAASTIPLLRAKLDAVLEAEGAPSGSREAERITSAFDAVPRSAVLALGPPALHAHVRAILEAPEATNARVDYQPDALDRGAVVLVTLPRDRFAREMFRRTEQRLVQASGASAVLDRDLFLGDDHVRMHFYLAAQADTVASFRVEELRGPVMELLRTWEDRLRDELRRLVPAHLLDEVVARYGAALPAAYKAHHDIGTAAQDVLFFYDVLTSLYVAVDFADDPTLAGRFGILKLIHADRDFIVGEWVRAIGRLGLGVHQLENVDVELEGTHPLALISLRVRDEHGPLDLARTASLTIPALRRLQAGVMADDELNALIPRAGLAWRQVDVLRACVGYAAQSGIAGSSAAAMRALSRHPQSARLLWEYFAARFDPMDPAPARDRATRTLPEIERRFDESLRAGLGDAERLVLRNLLAVLRATSRTNYFLSSVSGSAVEEARADVPPIALEIVPGELGLLRGRQPARETFVSGNFGTGVHLRDADIARGGIALHPSVEGLRDAVLRRLDRQVARNAPITAHAAQGGLFVAGDAGSPARREAAYRSFVGALLDLTDNVQEGRPKTPAGVVAYGAPDPYRVVGPGPGTAALLTAANEVARQRESWLGTGFAALAGRDEQRLAAEVAARGAWEALRRSFAELGRDVDREEITVVAIGPLGRSDLAHMLLLSRRLRLVAAFDERHVFLDPAPDPARSFSERERLLRADDGGWEAYDREKISDGGGVFTRRAGRLELAPAALDLLGLDAEGVDGKAVVRAILGLDVDLVVSAGGGILAKAEMESDADAADPANSDVRIDGAELGGRVVAELGDSIFTRAGRVEYALAGGRIHTSGVDLGVELQLRDRQVNVEIAIGPTAEGPRLTAAERLPLAAESRSRNAEMVLGRCRDRVRARSLDRGRSIGSADDFADTISQLETDGFVDRARQALPTREALRQRRGQFAGLAHPELGLIEAHAKVALREQLVDSNLPDDAFFERYLRRYFPEAVDARCGQGVRSHRLRRRIVAAEIATALHDRMGVTFLARVRRDTGATPAHVARCWAVAAELARADEIWGAIGGADPALPLAGESVCWNAVVAAVERATRWLVRTQPEDAAATVLFDAFDRTVEEVRANRDTAVPPALADHSAAQVESIAARGVPRNLAQQVVDVARFAEELDIASIALEHNLDARFAAIGYFRLTDLLDLEWLDRRVAEVVPRDRWEKRVALGLSEDLMALRRAFAVEVLHATPEAVDAVAAIDAYLVAHQGELTRIGALIDDVTSAPEVTLAALAVVVREISQLATRTV